MQLNEVRENQSVRLAVSLSVVVFSYCSIHEVMLKINEQDCFMAVLDLQDYREEYTDYWTLTCIVLTIFYPFT